MKHAPLLAVGLATCLLLVSVLVVASPATQSAVEPPRDAATDKDAGLFHAMCNDCHESTRIVAIRRTKSDWQDVLNKMIDSGAGGTGQEFETVFQFLLRHYGKVYVNSAPADQIAVVLGLPKKDADAIVAYRTAHGEFPDFEAVKKVPDVDVKILEEHKDAAAF